MTWVVENWDLVSALITAVIGILLTTKWGVANRKALETVMRSIEVSDKASGLALDNLLDSFAIPEANKSRLKKKLPQVIGAKAIKSCIKVEEKASSVDDIIGAVVGKIDDRKKPEPVGKKIGKFVGKAALGLLLRRFR